MTEPAETVQLLPSTFTEPERRSLIARILFGPRPVPDDRPPADHCDQCKRRGRVG